MSIICPTVLASDKAIYKEQIEKVAHLGNRIQIDLTDGQFAKTGTLDPEAVWWPVGLKADIHLMYQEPMSAAEAVIKHNPSMIIIHAEAGGDFNKFATYCRDRNVKIGVALLPPTTPEVIAKSLAKIDHVLIFSGDLGSFGGHADLSLLSKVEFLKKQRPELEVGWDGGVNLQNVARLVEGGVDVLNVGGYLQNSEDSSKAYAALARIADETGTT
jgi:ribulose-phosphate 3-epimerase